MADQSYRHNEVDLYTISGFDPLGILSSTRVVVQQGQYAWINLERIEALCDYWLHHTQDTTPILPTWDTRYHFFDGTEKTINWLLVLDALNFCFWAEKDQPRWTIEYQGETLNGYWAEAAALKRGVEEGIPLWDATFLSNLSAETLAHIFRGSETIPLFDARLAHAHEVGNVLLERFDGQFTNAIEQCHQSAIALVKLLVEHFPSFRDIATYHTHEVRFLKRAQICVADIASAFSGQSWGIFHDLDQLTIFADYKLPQVLRHYNVIEYHSTLAQQVDQQELLPAGSPQEVEIRAVTIWACELLRRAMQQRGHRMTSAEIDMHLWLMGQQSSDMNPYHRTRTIFY